MDEAQVAMLVYLSAGGSFDKHPTLNCWWEREEFVAELEATPLDQLKPIHLQLFAALGIHPPEQGQQPTRDQPEPDEWA